MEPKYKFTNKKGSLKIVDESTPYEDKIIVKFIPDNKDGEREIANTDKFRINKEEYKYCKYEVEAADSWLYTSKWRYKLHFKKNCENKNEKPLILSTKWLFDIKTQPEIQNVIMIYKEFDEDSEQTVPGGKKYRKSRRKSKRTKKTAKRRR